MLPDFSIQSTYFNYARDYVDVLDKGSNYVEVKMIARATYRSIFMTAALMLCCASAPVLAADIVIRPLMKAEYRLDSNYFRAQDNDREVHTYLLQPGFEFGYEAANSSLLLNYTLDVHVYDDQESVVLEGQRSADDDDYTGHTLSLEGRYNPFKRLRLGIDESFRYTRDAAQTDRLNNSVAREKFTVNRVTPSLFYDFEPKFTVGLSYRNTATDYSPAASEDSVLHTGIFNLIYNFNRTLSLDLEYEHAQMDYDLNSADYSSDQAKLILKKAFRLFDLEAGAGYQNRSFDGDNLGDIDNPVAHLTLTATPELFPGRLRFDYDGNFNELGTGDSYYLAHRFTLSVFYEVGQNIETGFDGYYQTSDYETEDRTDDKFDISINIGYRFTDWLMLKLFGGFENRDSNQDGRDYDNAYIMCNVDIDYDFGRK